MRAALPLAPLRVDPPPIPGRAIVAATLAELGYVLDRSSPADRPGGPAVELRVDLPLGLLRVEVREVSGLDSGRSPGAGERHSG
jgi:hypothetical protein